MPAPLNLTGQTFGRLVVLDRSHRANGQSWKWRCRCECGRTVTVQGSILKAGLTRACQSCANAASNTTHGLSDTPLYRRWQAMKARCGNPNNKHFANYGGRGIAVCERWATSFENFAADMGPTFDPSLELDRVDVNAGYCPDNCRWADRVTQQRNRRDSHLLTHNGRTLTVVEWAGELGVKPNTLYTRLRRDWPIERVLLELANQAEVGR